MNNQETFDEKQLNDQEKIQERMDVKFIKEFIKEIGNNSEFTMENNIEKKKDKLYLNKKKGMNIVTKIKKMNPYIKMKKLFKYMSSYLKIKTHTQSIYDLFDLLKYITIHGIIGTPIILLFATILNLNMPFIQMIHNSSILFLLVLILGTGGLYYIFQDVNQMLKDIYGGKK